jgi:hypothetical protein
LQAAELEQIQNIFGSQDAQVCLRILFYFLRTYGLKVICN